MCFILATIWLFCQILSQASSDHPNLHVNLSFHIKWAILIQIHESLWKILDSGKFFRYWYPWCRNDHWANPLKLHTLPVHFVRRKRMKKCLHLGDTAQTTGWNNLQCKNLDQQREGNPQQKEGKLASLLHEIPKPLSMKSPNPLW